MLPRLFCLVSRSEDLDRLPELADAGLAGIQIRDKTATTRDLIALTERVRTVVPAGCVIVDDRLDVALAGPADGVHLGADDLPVATARTIADAVRPGLIIGATCRDRDAVARATEAGADYAGFGPVGASSSKAGLPEPLGVSAVAAAAGGIPLIAIGGIDVATATAVRRAGAHGVAVIGGIWRDPDPVQAAKELLTAVA